MRYTFGSQVFFNTLYFGLLAVVFSLFLWFKRTSTQQNFKSRSLIFGNFKSDWIIYQVISILIWLDFWFFLNPESLKAIFSINVSIAFNDIFKRPLLHKVVNKMKTGCLIWTKSWHNINKPFKNKRAKFEWNQIKTKQDL